MPLVLRPLAALTLLAMPLVACGGNAPAYDHELAHYAFEKAHIAKLPGGERLAVGSRTGHDVTVQWGDGERWSAPEEVVTVPDLWTHDVTLREHDGTAGISADFWNRQKLDDDYDPVRTRIVVCRDHACSAGPQPDGLATADVAEDGSLVSYGTARRRVVFWEDGTFRTEEVSGLPADGAIRTTPEGAFLAIAARKEDGLCHQDLYAAPRGSAAFTLAAREPGRRAQGECSAYAPDVDRSDPDHVTVYVDDAVDRLEFVRKDGHWSPVVPKVATIDFPDTGGRTSIAPVQVNAATEFLVGSPDLRSIVVQARRSGTREWNEPTTVAHAPKGTLCRWAAGEGTETGGGVALVNCYPESLAWDPAKEQAASVALAIATADGSSWSVRTLTRPRSTVGFGPGYVLVQGAEESLVWRASSTAFEVLHLPSDPLWDQLSLVDDGTKVLRLSGNGDQHAVCRPRWSLTTPTATAWPAAHPLPDAIQQQLEKGTCTFEAWGDGHHLEAGVHGGVFQAEFSVEVRGDDVVVKPWGQQ